MAIEIIGNDRGAVMTCTTSDWAFGPVFDSEESAEQFLDWHREKHGDPRKCDDATLSEHYADWLLAKSEAQGECYYCDKPVYKDQEPITIRSHLMHKDCAEKHGDLEDETAESSGPVISI